MAAPDALLRIALLSWAGDRTAALTDQQRVWVAARLRRVDRTPLTAQERARLKAPLLAWAQTRFTPDVVAKLAAQFPQEVAHGHAHD